MQLRARAQFWWQQSTLSVRVALLQAYISSPTFGVEYDGTAAIDVAAQQRGQQQQQ